MSQGGLTVSDGPPPSYAEIASHCQLASEIISALSTPSNSRKNSSSFQNQDKWEEEENVTLTKKKTKLANRPSGRKNNGSQSRRVIRERGGGEELMICRSDYEQQQHQQMAHQHHHQGNHQYHQHECYRHHSNNYDDHQNRHLHMQYDPNIYKIDPRYELMIQHDDFIQNEIKNNYPLKYITADCVAMLLLNVSLIGLQIVAMYNNAALSYFGSAIWAGLYNLGGVTLAILSIKYRNPTLMIVTTIVKLFGMIFSFGGFILVHMVAFYHYNCIAVSYYRPCYNSKMKNVHYAIIILGVPTMILSVSFFIYFQIKFSGRFIMHQHQANSTNNSSSNNISNNNDNMADMNDTHDNNEERALH